MTITWIMGRVVDGNDQYLSSRHASETSAKTAAKRIATSPTPERLFVQSSDGATRYEVDYTYILTKLKWRKVKQNS